MSQPKPAAVLSELVERVYASVGDASRGSELLERLAAATRSTVATRLHQDVRGEQGAIHESFGQEPAYRDAYANHFANLNVWMHHRPELLAFGNVCTSEMLCPTKVLLRSEFFNDYLRPQNVGRLLGVTTLRDGDWYSMVSVFRPQSCAPYGRSERRLFEALLPHFRQAARLERRVAFLDERATATGSVIDRLPMGVVLLNRDGAPLTVNRVAQEILDANDGLVLLSSGLRATHPAEVQQFADLIGSARMLPMGLGFGAGGTMTLRRPSGRRPLMVLVTPLRGTVGADRTTESVAVFITDPERAEETSEAALQRLYGLTPAEARLTAVLVEGATLTEAAELLGVTRHTVRSQLKNSLMKTGTHSQNALISQVLRSVTQFR